MAGSTPARPTVFAGDARQAGHRSRKADEVGSSPTAGFVPFRCSSDGQSVALKTRRPLVRPQPPELAACGNIHRDVLLGEQPVSNSGPEGSTPSVSADAPVAERSRHRLAKSDRWVRLPPGAIVCPVTQRVWRPVCQAGETGSSPVQGVPIGLWPSGQATV